MEKEQIEIELKKIETEKLKIKEGIFRSLIFLIVAVATGIGTVMYQIYDKQTLNYLFLIVLSTILIITVFVASALYISIRKKLKEL